MSTRRAGTKANRVVRRGLVLVALSLLFSSNAAHAGFVFGNVIDTTGPYSGFLGGSINNQGQLAFEAFQGPNAWNFVSNGVTTTTIAQTGPAFSILFAPSSINDSGTVSFTGVTPQSVTSLYTGSGGPLTTIASEGAMFSSLGGGMINNAGNVVFEGRGTNDGIYVGNGGALTTIAQSGSTYSGFGGAPAINQFGLTAFQAGLTGGGAGVFASNGGSTTTIFQTSTLQPGNPTINNAGTAAFTLQSSSGFSIVTGNGGPLSTIATTTGGVFSNFQSNPDINNHGQVAFLGDLSAGGTEIMSGTAGNLEKVIATGDSLFGSTVTYLAFNTYGFNDEGQVSFYYILANGVNGLAIATPNAVPEPGSITLAFVGFVVVLSIVGFGRRRVEKPVMQKRALTHPAPTG